MSTAIVWSDNPELAAELAGKAAAIGAAAHAFDASGLPDNDSVTLSAAIADAAKRSNADLVLIGSTKKGRDVGPRVGAHLDWPYASDCQDIRAQNGWTVERMVLSGNSRATYTMGPKAVCSAVPKTFEKGAPAAGKAAGSAAGPSPVKVTAKEQGHQTDFDLGSAAVVVGVGRGFKQQGDIKLAEQLAACFPGGAVGCSRPIAADLKWLGEEHWIGLSGHAIKPKAYIACGISGQIQHIAGIRGSKLIVAVNTNKDAPIFQVADYGVVGDLYQVIPKLVAALKG